jgi:hypothetical protein
MLRKPLLHRHRNTTARRTLNPKLIHQPAGPSDAPSHSEGSIPAPENCVDVCDSRTGIANADVETIIDSELDLALSGVVKRIASDLGNGSGDSSLLLRIETEETGNPPGTLPRGNHVLLAPQPDSEDR